MNERDRPAHLWKKGESGNPGGRPKGLGSLLRERSSDLRAQIEELIRLSTGAKSEKTRLEAIGMILDRVYGKALETKVTAELGDAGKLAFLEGLTLAELGDLARGSMTPRVTIDAPHQIGSTSVVNALGPALQLSAITALNTKTQGSTVETRMDDAESQDIEPSRFGPESITKG